MNGKQLRIVKRFQEIHDRLTLSDRTDYIEVLKTWYLQDVGFLADQLSELHSDYNELEEASNKKSWFSKLTKSGEKIKRN